MPTPKRKTSKGRRDRRRSHHAIKLKAVVKDKDSGNKRRSHRADKKTGKYKGRQVMPAAA
jgi:large subunit ribosomal protein L32